jgi:hypothetical protein
MRQKSETQKPSSERIVKDIRRATRKQYSAEEKIVSCWTAFGVSTTSRSCGQERAAETREKSGVGDSPLEIKDSNPKARVILKIQPILPLFPHLVWLAAQRRRSG